MKRCPQCEFIYPDADMVCDFDRTTLVEAEESEIAQITNTPERPKLSDLAATHSKNFGERKSSKASPIAAASGLILGIAMVSGYLTLQHVRSLQVIAQIEPIEVQSVMVGIPKPTLKPSTAEHPAPEQVSSLPPKSEQTTSQTTTPQSRSSAGPISTGATGNSSKSQVIILTTGNKVEADQVWRTKDGVWYRKNGIVTLLKKNRVKTIVGR